MEFWIMNKDGLPFFHERANEKIQSVNEDMVSCFFSAFNQMILKASNQDVEAIRFKDSKIIFVPGPQKANFYVIGRIPMKANEKDAKKSIDKVIQYFIDDFWCFIEHWTGNVSIFLNFSNRLKEFWV
jgi:hypothetical protein